MASHLAVQGLRYNPYLPHNANPYIPYLFAAVLVVSPVLVELEEVDAERLERPPHLVQLRLNLLLLAGRSIALPHRRERTRRRSLDGQFQCCGNFTTYQLISRGVSCLVLTAF